MRNRMLAVALAVACSSAAAHAQTAQEQENLRNLLNKKFGTQTRGVVRQQDDRLKREDYYYVKPDGSVEKAPSQQKSVPERRSSSGSTWGDMMSDVWDWALKFFSAPKPKGHEGATATAGATRGPQPEGVTVPADEQKVLQLAQSGVSDPVAVKRNSYVIQLKADVTSAQIDAILEKYELEVTKYDEDLGWLYVSQKSSGTRSAAPERDPATLGQLLSPRIIKDLRHEPGVDAAFVNSGMKPNAVPGPVKTQSESNGVTYRWYWNTGVSDDGNWGLKAMRLPPVWSILQRYRQLNPGTSPVRVAVFDAGFGKHSDLAYSSVFGGLPPPPLLASCKYSHGTHVAGIVGAGFGNKIGTDGVVPNSAVVAVPIGQDEPPPVTPASAEDAVQPDALFANVVQDTAVFLGGSLSDDQPHAVVNFSLGYNWFATGALTDKMPYEDDNLRDHIENQGIAARRLAHKFRNKVLFVQAAGNDSGWLEQPLAARWASPFGWAGLAGDDNLQPSDNILVVEAIGRDKDRAIFSNVGGHVAAPGVDVMSTLAGLREGYGMCSGTSQAAPHVAALASILFELAPEKQPSEIANIIRETAASPPAPAAAPQPAPVEEAAKPAPKTGAEVASPAPSEYDTGPTQLGASSEAAPSAAPAATAGPQIAVRYVDALEAVLSLSPKMAQYLADLNVDGKVDSADLEKFRDDLTEIETVKAGGMAFEHDLNGDGEVDEDENCWPLIDLNGSGRASFDEKTDGRMVQGKVMSDLDIVGMAWTDTAKDFKTALKETGLQDRISQWRDNSVALISGGNATATRPKIPCD